MGYTKKEFIKNRYKDRDPVDTIFKIKKIIKDLGFETEVTTKETEVGVHWSYMYLIHRDKIVAKVAGKGNTKELSLASLYGEMIERLSCCPQHIYDDFCNLYNKKILELDEFVYSPDEIKILDKEDYKKNNEYMQKLKSLGQADKIDDIIDTMYESYGYIPTENYTEYSTGRTKKLNTLLTYTINGSAGLASGNTKYEALLHAICEKTESYVNSLVYSKNMCLPIIPEEVIKKYEYVYGVYKKINSTGRYRVEFRDASLGIGIPATCVIIYDKVIRGYAVNFASFPVMEISLERCINEILQGQMIGDIECINMIRNYESFTDVLIDNRTVEKDMNGDLYWYIKGRIDDDCIFKDRFVGDNYDYEFMEWEENPDCTNKEYFDVMCNNIINKIGDEVYYKSFSYIGWDVYIIICPKMTCGFHLTHELLKNCKKDRRRVIEKGIFSGEIDYKEEIDVLCKTDFNGPMGGVLGRPLKPYFTNFEIIKGFAYFVKGEYRKSAFHLQRQEPEFGKIDGEKERILKMDLWFCLCSYIGMMDSIKDRNEIKNILGKFFVREVVDYIDNACSSSDRLKEELFTDKESQLNIINWEELEVKKDLLKVVRREQKKGMLKMMDKHKRK